MQFIQVHEEVNRIKKLESEEFVTEDKLKQGSVLNSLST